jgi:hypothetical protein
LLAFMVPFNGHIPRAVLVSNTSADKNVHLKISLLRMFQKFDPSP